ncbi:Canalicular multispecific organic anion transporter 2, partial [Armadillidium nasatum]
MNLQIAIMMTKTFQMLEAMIPLRSFKSFIDDRDGKKGKISKWNYVVYLEACGWALGSIYIVFMIANQGALVALDLWLGRWSKMCQNSTCNVNKTTDCSEYEYEDMNKSNRISFNLSLHDKVSPRICQHSVYWLGLAIFIGLFSILLNQFAAHKGRRFLHEKLLEAVVYARNRVFDSCNAFGRITIRFTSDVNIIDKELGWSIMHFTYFSLICLSAIVVNSIISPLFILLALPLCLIYYAIQHIFKCSSRELKRIELASQSPVASLVNEIAEYPPVIRAYGIQNKFFSCFCRRIDSYLSSYVLFHAGNRWLGISLDYLGSCIVFLATIACLIGSTVDLGFLLTPLTIGFAIKYTLSIPTYLNVLVRYLTYTENGLSSVERIQDYTNLKPEEAFEANERFLPRIRDHLLFENVSLYYNDSNPVIKDISFSIPVKQKVGICGRTGSGKSSILSGILRMLERQEGTIFLSGMDTLKVPLTVLRKNISVVIQDVCVFEDTVRFNVDPENTHSDSEIWSALEKVHLKEMISNMPEKLESLIGAGNLTLSSGQAQLLVISRILLDKRNLLLLDEFGAHLDAETESRILVMIKEEFVDSTVIMVTVSLFNIYIYIYIY